MELDKQIKKYRMEHKWSQEDLAEKVYVTRQTISNWETGKCYPDVHSLLLLSTVFETTFDQLIKGDIEMMNEQIKAEDVRVFKKYSNVFSMMLLVSVGSIAPLAYYFGRYGLAISAVLFIMTLLLSLKVEKYKKINNIQTYKEINAFMEGKRLDEIDQHYEFGKRPYQQALIVISFGIASFIIITLIFKILEVF